MTFDRELRLSRAARWRALGATDGTAPLWRESVAADIRWLFSLIFRATFGYGHKPARALWWIILPILTAALLSHQTYNTGQMAPNSAVILASDEWATAMHAEGACVAMNQTSCDTPSQIWAETSRAAMDWETFSPGLYALDLYVPVLDLGQVSAWAPSKDRGPWGWWMYWARMPVQVIGWLILLVGAAVVTGLVGRREEE